MLLEFTNTDRIQEIMIKTTNNNNFLLTQLKDDEIKSSNDKKNPIWKNPKAN